MSKLALSSHPSLRKSNSAAVFFASVNDPGLLKSNSSSSNNVQKTPPTRKVSQSLDSLDHFDQDEVKKDSFVETKGLQEDRKEGLQSTAETDNQEKRSKSGKIVTSESRKEDEQEVNLRISGGNKAGSPQNPNRFPIIEPFTEQLEDFSGTQSPSKNEDEEGDEEEEDFDESPMSKPKAFLVVQTKTLTPYLSNVKASPFLKDATPQNQNSIYPSPLNPTDIGTDFSEKVQEYLKENEEIKKEKKRIGKETFSDAKLLERICSFLEYGDATSLAAAHSHIKDVTELKRNLKKIILKLLSSKPEKEQQYLFWQCTANIHQDPSDDSLWKKNVAKACEAVEDICKDLDRTLPEHEIFQTEEGRNPLLRVLMTICNTHPEMGYVQGLNSLVGVTLFYLNEEESYLLMQYLLNNLHAKDIYYPDFKGLEVLNYQLEAYLNHYLPEITKFFKENSMSISYYTYSWFITLFADNLNLANTIKVWNFFFIKGFSFLIQFALALFSIHKNELISMDIDEVGMFLKSKLWELDQKEENIFTIALSFKVTNKAMKDLENIYNSGKSPQVQLITPNDNQKSYWERVDKHWSPKQPISPNKKLDESKTLKWHEKPFFQNVLNTVTFEIPETFRQIFKKSPPVNPQPNAQTSPQQKPHELTDPNDSHFVPILETENHEETLFTETNSYRPRMLDLEKPLLVIGEVSLGSISEEEKDHVETNEYLPSENDKENALRFDSQNMQPKLMEKKSIVKRGRKSIENRLGSKIDSFEEPEKPFEEHHPKKCSTPSQSETMIVLNWDELNETRREGLDENKRQNSFSAKEIEVDNESESSYQSARAENDLNSETDWKDQDDEIPILMGETSYKYLGDCSVINHSKSWPENQI